jgi:ATP-dependent Lon protease
MTGEITIMGKVLAVGGVLPKLQAAIDAGCAEVLLPTENERDVQMTPDYVRNKIKVRFVSSIQEVLSAALVPQDDLHVGDDLHEQTRTASS